MLRVAPSHRTPVPHANTLTRAAGYLLENKVFSQRLRKMDGFSAILKYLRVLKSRPVFWYSGPESGILVASLERSPSVARFPSLHGRVRAPPTLSGDATELGEFANTEGVGRSRGGGPAPPGRCWLASSAAPWGVGAGAIIGPPIQKSQSVWVIPVERTVKYPY